MNISDADVRAVYDVAIQDRLAGRHEGDYAPGRWTERSPAQRLAYDAIFFDGPGAV